MRHFRNQRAAAVRVHIGANAVGDAHFANPGKLLQALEKLPRVQAEPQLQEKTSGDGSLQFARSSQGDHPAVVDDGKALAERVGFFHVVRGEQNGFAGLVVLANDLPQ